MLQSVPKLQASCACVCVCCTCPARCDCIDLLPVLVLLAVLVLLSHTRTHTHARSWSATLLAEVLYLSCTDAGGSQAWAELEARQGQSWQPASQPGFGVKSFVIRPRSWLCGGGGGVESKSAWQAFYLKEIAFSTFFTLGSSNSSSTSSAGSRQ